MVEAAPNMELGRCGILEKVDDFWEVIVFLERDNYLKIGVEGGIVFLDRIPGQVNNMRDLVEVRDEDCKKMLRMD
ncbi:hypothetical protein ACS0TY_034459 [Phlomoides rotata]